MEKRNRGPRTSRNLELSEGFVSEAFATNTTKRGDKFAELLRPRIIIHATEFCESGDIIPIMMDHEQSDRALLFIGAGIKGDALETLALNVKRGGLRCAAVRVSGSPERQRVLLDCVASITGGKVLDDLGIHIRDLATSILKAEAVGEAKKVRIARTSTKIFGGVGKPRTYKNATIPNSVVNACADKPKARRFNGRDYRVSDARLVAQMYELLQKGEAASITDAARAVVADAQGSKNEASKVTRLGKRYRETHSP